MVVGLGRDSRLWKVGCQEVFYIIGVVNFLRQENEVASYGKDVKKTWFSILSLKVVSCVNLENQSSSLSASSSFKKLDFCQDELFDTFLVCHGHLRLCMCAFIISPSFCLQTYLVKNSWNQYTNASLSALVTVLHPGRQ